MDASDKSLPDLVKSWIPWRSEPANVSRDFWMPDQSCRVCYECDLQFTFINRRHHCRLCGRVFCAKCTSNWVPPPFGEPSSTREECEKIRVCNFCFIQWDNAGVDFNSSPSGTSFTSNKSNATPDSSIITVGSMPLSSDQTVIESNRNEDSVAGTRSPHRSDEEEDEYDLYQLESHFPQLSCYYGPHQFDEIDYGTLRVNLEGEYIDTTSTSPLNHDCDSETIERIQQLVKEEKENDIGDECEEASPVYPAETADIEPFDFENSGVLWLPPDPADGEDERDSSLYDDEDDVDVGGEWGYARSSNSLGSGENSNSNRSNVEHKKVMKNVVDGHFRALVAQLLQVENLPLEEDGDDENWLDIVASLCWEATSLLKPDTSKGGGMDPGGYVKIKCIASGRPSQSVVVKGVVCKKNVANKRMTSRIEKARFMILGGALEYQRVSNHLSSFDTLLQQEMDHLKMAVAKIDAHNPDVLLVEKSVSRYAQEYLLAKNISLVLNIKRPLLERIARCTGGQIVPSIDHLSSQKLGYCEIFHVERFLEEHGSAGQGGKKLLKTLMYIEGCPLPLGCTILLRGANGDELKKVKHVIQYAVFAAYHLALETSFLADEGASLPELPLDTPITVALPDKPSNDRSISTIPGYSIPTIPKNSKKPNIPTSDVVSINIDSSNHRTDKTSFSSSDTQYPVDNNVVILKEPKTRSDWKSEDGVESVDSNGFVANNVQNGYAVQSSAEQIPSKEEFPPSPSDNQSILVSLSSRCVWKGTVCERSHLFRIKYYGNFDKPLGSFLRDNLFDQSYICRSCEMPSEAHVHCYTHTQGTLTISVKKWPEYLLSGEEEGKLWMWHRCLRCPRIDGFPPATKRIVMSDAAWGLSFGKFLELSFSNHAAASRVASCGHSLHRDCLRFYGFGRMVACFRYASIDVHSVFLPPSKLDFNYDRQEWIQKELNEVVVRADLLFSEVLKALHQMAEKRSGTSLLNSAKIPESIRQLADLESMLHKEREEFEESLHTISNKEHAKEGGQPVVDILEINRLRRQLLFQSYMWDHRLIYIASIDSSRFQEDDCNPEHVEDGHLSESSDSTTFKMNKSGEVRENLSHVSEKGEVIVKKGVIEDEALDKSHVRNKSLSNLSVITKSSHDVSADDSESPVTGFRRTLPDGHAPIMKSLSDTLDAAWTGGNLPGIRIANDSESTVSDSSTTTATAKKFEIDDRSPLALSSKGSDNMEDSVSWLGMPFINFYRSLNKNFLWGAQKLDSLSEYNPVYVSSFREAELQGGARLLLPVGLNDTVVPVFDDEPTSIISYALLSSDYLEQLSDEFERPKDNGESPDSGNLHSSFTMDEMTLESFKSMGSIDDSFLSMSGSRSSLALDHTKALHAKVSFSDDGPLGKVKYTVICYHAKCFEALRRISCPSEMDFVRSLSRCKKWGAQGGKSNVFFAKTSDDRFIIKQVTKTELESFIKFAPAYFKYLSESLGTGSPTCLAKVLGIYQVTSKHLKGGKETKMDVLIMENLLFRRTVTRLYDLKGSSRSRYNPDCNGSNKVLLDQNLIEAMPTCPIFVGNKAKRILERAVWNDTAFLASVDVMDYSLLVGVDEEKQELVLGIIDFMRQYTWDKHLETWVKASGILGGPKNVSPTVISPKQYKKRFRKAMTTYFLMVPDQWSPPSIVPSKSHSDLQNSQEISNTT